MYGRLYELLDRYIRYHDIEGHTQDTQRFYRKEVGIFLRWLDKQGHSMLVQDVTSMDILDHMGLMKDNRCSPTSIHTRRRALKSFFQWAIQWELLTVNPVDRIPPPKIPKVRKPFAKESDFQAMLAWCPLNTLLGARRQAMLWLLSTTGIRKRELSLLTIDDLGWEAEEIRVRNGKGQKERTIAFLKSGAPVQKVFYHYLWQRTDALGCLWVTAGGKPLGYEAVGQDLTRLGARAGLDLKDACHIWRRTSAAQALRQGYLRPHIRKAWGWESDAMLEHYTRMMEEEDHIEAFKGFNPWAK